MIDARQVETLHDHLSRQAHPTGAVLAAKLFARLPVALLAVDPGG